jgi:hypothetical protein
LKWEIKMDDRKLSRRQVLKAAGALGVAAVAFDPIKAFADDDESSGRVTWDLINVNFVNGSPTHITRGGHAEAKSTNGNHVVTAEITVTGHGTFPNTDKCSKNVTGGGTWAVTGTTDPACFPGSGKYRVTELLSWHPASGTLPLPDSTGDKGKPSSGLATLRVLYDNGRRGTLTVSCHLPVGAPACTFEGITASMDYQDFWQTEAAGAVEGNRTLFHISSNGEGD